MLSRGKLRKSIAPKNCCARRSNALLSFMLALLMGCAVMEAPSGGPVDKKPPKMVAISPQPNSSAVPRNIRPQFVFDEKIDEEGFKNRILVFPEIRFDKLVVDGERLELRFAELLPETTVCIVIRAGYRDIHREVASSEPVIACFSTAAQIDSGTVEGAIYFKNRPDSNGVVELFILEDGRQEELVTSRRARVAFAKRNGLFSFCCLPTSGERFVLRGFIDKDNDGYYSPSSELAAMYEDTIILDVRTSAVSEVKIIIIDPNEPALLEGKISNQTGLELPATIKLTPTKAKARALVCRADSIGVFSMPKIPPGGYTVSIFVDMQPDTLCGSYKDPADSTQILAEPCILLPDTLILHPGEKKTLENIILK